MSKKKAKKFEDRKGSGSARGLRLFDRDRGILGDVAYSLRRRILTGIFIMVPIVISFLPVFFIYPRLNAFAVRYLGIDMPGVGFIVALLIVLAALYIVGILSATFVVRWTVALGEAILNKIPIVNFLYRTTKQAVELVVSAESPAFRRPVLIEYPRRGIYAMAFATGEGQYPPTLGRQIHVFLPTTPNPTSGVLLLLSPDQVHDTGLSIDEATRFIISGGILELGDLELKTFSSDPTPIE